MCTVFVCTKCCSIPWTENTMQCVTLSAQGTMTMSKRRLKKISGGRNLLTKFLAAALAAPIKWRLSGWAAAAPGCTVTTLSPRFIDKVTLLPDINRSPRGLVPLSCAHVLSSVCLPVSNIVSEALFIQTNEDDDQYGLVWGVKIKWKFASNWIY